LGLLSDQAVALAGLAVRDILTPERIGYTPVFTNELLTAGWAPRTSADPYDVPYILGCCIAARAETFTALGGFDEGMRGRGVEDIELGLRAWMQGYRCAISPRRAVQHRFTSDEDRRLTVGWEQYDYNLLRCAVAHFDGSRLAGTVAAVREHPRGTDLLLSLLDDPAFEERLAMLGGRAVHDMDWYCARFSGELHEFETRLTELAGGGGEHRVCRGCGALLAGRLVECLRCGTPLEPSPEATPAAAVPPSSPALALGQRDTRPCPGCGQQVPSAAKHCPRCGAQLPAATVAATPTVVAQSQPAAALACAGCGAAAKSGVRFCGNCGTPLAAPTPPPPDRPMNLHCPQCGREYGLQAKFCAGCGHRFV
ncbi:MAG: zinc ribbon domain-containing protein, partial [Anaerolineaceae bacterium]